MATYRTPGVYVEEISTLPPSVAEVSTAVPAFIGCTANGPTPDNDDKVVPIVARINTLLEYETIFGKAPPSSFEVLTHPVKGNGELTEVDAVNFIKPPYEYLLYYSLSLYFKNGGGSCYVVSIGNYKTSPKKGYFKAGLDELEKEDEPTLILLTDAVNLTDSADYYALCRDALKQCKKLKDRFAILDVLKSDGVKKFRNGEIGTEFLKYGAAYHPYLQTSLNRHYEPTSVAIKLNKGEYRTHANGILVTYDGPQKDNPQVKITITQRATIGFEISNDAKKLLTIRLNTGGADVAKIVEEWGNRDPKKNASFNIESNGDGSQKVTELVAETDLNYTSPEAKPGKFQTDENGLLVTYNGPQKDIPKVKIEFNSAIGFNIQDNVLKISLPQSGADVAEIVKEWGNRDPNKNASFNIESSGDGSQKVTKSVVETPLTYQLTLRDPVMKNEKTDLYNRIKTELDKQRVVLPPSAAVAGVYARVDRERGVWKAPANVSLSSVISPVVKITNADQESLNIDPTAGKSINAIRAFTGKGTLIWGARTLAGNDNEWRYVSVRRLFIMIEESTMKSTSFAVFEPNDATTWLKVKGMIESYLYGLWERGALAGSTPEAAYFVNVGLGKTMTAQDVLEGRMIVEIGVAAVRPAEFIIIKFTHKLQEA